MADSDRPWGEEKAEGVTGRAAGAANAAGDKLSGAAGVASGAAGAAGAALSGLGGAAGDKLSGAAGAATGAAGALAGSAGGKLTASTDGAKKLAASGSGRGGWRSFVPPNKNGKFPWRKRWLGLLPFAGLALLCGWMGWTSMEDGLEERALVHLECEGVDTSELDFDWSYRSVTVDGQLPTGVTADRLERIIDDGSTDASCLADAGIDADDNPGVYNIAVPAAAAAVVAAVPDPDPTATPVPAPTATPVPEATATPEPDPTATPEPEPTAEPQIAALAAAAVYDGQNITLTGEVANEEQRAALVAAAIAAVGEANVTDQLTISDGDASDTSDTRIQELSDAIATFGSSNVIRGQASIDDAALTYDVVSPSDDAAAALDYAGTGSIEVLESSQPSFTG